ncbi:MAG: T9SS type A sorting domain-containing protein [Bacteroidia bacterium]|nr:T9SS type A sorting domain-containing protein [Bacteroidia bacterium]MCX7763584.1 T9SS type A sorting domain-containing protein [Bacteroidia bacterium]MDW8057799.1 T9SS type A sorting domain-containing protein [Bacteroidia bacterium]
MIPKLTLGWIALTGLLWSQTLGTRFKDPVFEQVRVTKSIKYGENLSFTNVQVDLFMDVYEPVGDTMQKRPVIVLFHAGSFLPPSLASQAFGRIPIGSREDSGIVALCKEFARRGYVAISATHRLGWNPQASTQEARAQSIIQAVWRAMQDARALVRYLRKDAATTNQWRIDPDRIVMGGSSSGAYVALHVAYLNLPSELDNPKFKRADNTPFVDTTQPGLNRGTGPNAFEGGSGNPGYPSHIQAVLNLGGALGDTSFIQNENVPVISLHGVQDHTTPYTAGIVVTAVGNYPIIEVFGSYSLTENLIAKGNQTALYPDFANDRPFPGLYGFTGAGFEPFGWYSDSDSIEKARARRYIDTILWFATPRLFKVLNLPTIQMPLATSLSGNSGASGTFILYPNPATVPQLYVEHPSFGIQRLELYRLTGEKVAEISLATPTNSYTWSLPASLAQGIYILQVYTEKGVITQRWSLL